MTGINALSTGVSVKGKEEGFSVSEKAQAGTDSAIMEFAAILNGWVAQISGQGQNSGFQSNEPAGKEANSGRNALLGLEGLQALIGTLPGYGNPQEVLTQNVQDKQVQTLMGWTNGQSSEAPLGGNTLESLLAQLGNLQSAVAASNSVGTIGEAYRSGMMLEQPQGKNSPQSELDLYKGVISELLKDMSGQIRDKSHIDPENLNTKAQNKSLLAAQRMNSGLFTVLADEPLSQTQIQSQLQSQLQTQFQTQPISLSLSVQGATNAIPSDAINQQDNILPGNGLQQDVDPAKVQSSQSELIRTVQQSTASLDLEKRSTPERNLFISNLSQEIQDSRVLQKHEPMQSSGSENENMDLVQLSSQKGTLSKEVPQENKVQSSRLSLDGVDPQDSVTAGIGISSQAKENIQLQAKVEHNAELPIWAQVARDIHEKAFQARPNLRELDIQLHPAELGQVRLSLRWEDGQVHLRMTASESGTGQLLQSNFTELRDNLSQLGIQCGMLEMGFGDQQKGTHHQQGQDGSTKARTNSNEPQEVESIHELDALSGNGLQESKEINKRINVTA